ncbi:hypothetical protein FC093_19080 [Ilyomonas limi]|uniref:DNA repair protein n=1 Tax=Ilyomonas limi TaxID=2575867 RepID=A0A4U3KXG0_9BACT|nr:CRISPR-associated endonuclease Cas6 [Ilyomonas limi]TKK65856.1 hypothetical protein FC093_19080 [Ilyomonas limi]
MKKLKTLFVQFDDTLAAWEIPSFRGAVIEKVGRENVLFHQHNGKEGFIYQYPVIQYKSVQQKPSLLCLGDGVDEIHKFFGLRNWDVHINGVKHALKIHRLDMNNITVNVWEKQFKYSIQNWLALNEVNYQKYVQLNSLKEKVTLLERLLTGNILSFAKGIEWRVEKPVTVAIQELKGEKIIRYKGVPLVAFDVIFSCNVFLPNYLGLGKSASHGFGVIRQFRELRNQD